MACDGPAVVSEKVTEGVGREAEGQKPRVQKTAPEQAPWSDWQRVGVLQARHARNGVATACVGSSAGRWNHPGRGGAERGPNAADDLWPDPLVIRHAAAIPYVVDRLRGQVGSGAPFCPCAMHRAGSLRPDTRRSAQGSMRESGRGAYADCTLSRNWRTSASRFSASRATASARFLTSAAVARASLEAPATRLMDWAPTRASSEARLTPFAIEATAEFCWSTVAATLVAMLERSRIMMLTCSIACEASAAAD